MKNECNHNLLNDALYCPMCYDIYEIKRVEGLENLVKTVREQLPNIGGSFQADEAYFEIQVALEKLPDEE